MLFYNYYYYLKFINITFILYFITLMCLFRVTDMLQTTLPGGIPPTFKGTGIKYGYFVTIAAQRMREPAHILTIPFRIVSPTAGINYILSSLCRVTHLCSIEENWVSPWVPRLWLRNQSCGAGGSRWRYSCHYILLTSTSGGTYSDIQGSGSDFSSARRSICHRLTLKLNHNTTPTNLATQFSLFSKSIPIQVRHFTPIILKMLF